MAFKGEVHRGNHFRRLPGCIRLPRPGYTEFHWELEYPQVLEVGVVAEIKAEKGATRYPKRAGLRQKSMQNHRVLMKHEAQMGPRAPIDPPEWIPEKWVPRPRPIPLFFLMGPQMGPKWAPNCLTLDLIFWSSI